MLVRRVLLSAALSCAAASAQPRLTPVSRTDTALPATTAHGNRVVTARELLLDAFDKALKLPKVAVLVIFDSATGFFSYEADEVPPSSGERSALARTAADHGVIFVTEESMVRFIPLGSALSIKTSTLKARDVGDAEQKVLQILGDHVGDPKQFRSWMWSSQVRLPLSELGLDFFLPKFASIFAPTRLLAVSHREGAWELILENQWKAKVVLNDKFEIVETTRLE